MTNWQTHHPPHDHADFDAYLNTLTEADLAAINAATPKTDNDTPDTRNDIPEI